MTTTKAQSYVSIAELAGRTGLPLAWLRAEVKAGRLPSLRVSGRLVRVPLEAAERVLAKRAETQESGDGK